MPSNLTEQFHWALDLAAAGEQGRAAAALAECVAGDPQDLEFTDAFLKTLAELVGTRSGLAVEESAHSIKAAWQAKRWEEIRSNGPAVLLQHPGDVATLRALADAAAASGDYDIELRYLEAAGKVAPDSIELNRHRAKSLQRLGRFDEALACWGFVQDAGPDDAEAATMLAQLAIEQSRQRLGVDSADGRKFGVVRPSKPATGESGLQPIVYQDDRMIRDILRQADQHKRTPLQQLEAAVRDHPSNPDIILKLATLYMEKSREYEAEKLLAKAKEECEDPRVAIAWEDVAMIRLDRKVAAAEQHLETDQGEPAQAAVKDARKARDRFQTEVFLNRCQREPTNPQLRYELGLRHKQAGKMRDAYECFVVALDDPGCKALAACEMAECLQQAGKVVEALQYYRMASESAQPDQAECKKLALYRAGSLALSMRLHRLARRYLDRLVRLDPDYADSEELRASLLPGSL